MLNGGDSSLGSLLSLLGFVLAKMERVWTAIIYHTHLIRPNSWLSRKGCFFRPLIFRVISNLRINSRLLSNCGTGQKFSSTQRCLFRDTPPIIEYQEWKGPVFLPNSRGKFFAILAGETESYPFSPATDRFELKPSPRHPIFQRLVESNFAGKTWSLRSSSRHAKSKTYKQDFE